MIDALKIQKSFILWFLIFGTLVIISRIFFTYESNEFSYDVYQPDGFCYTYQSAKYLGKNSLEIDKLLGSMSSNYPTALDTNSVTQESCASTSGRALYPLLSSPFVNLLGPVGMLVIPIISYLSFLFLLMLSFHYLKINLITQFLVLSLVVCSTTISRWFIANLTDPLLYIQSSLLCFIFLFKNFHSRRCLTVILMLLILMGLTKRSLHIPVIIGTVLIFDMLIKRYKQQVSKEFFREFMTKVFAILFAFPFLVDFLVSRIFPSQNTLAILRLRSQNFEDNFSLVDIPKYWISSIAQIFVMDWPLAILISLWILLTLLLRPNLSLFESLGILAPVMIFLLSSLHLTLGLNLRFELNFIYPFVLFIAKMLDNFLSRKNLINH